MSNDLSTDAVERMESLAGKPPQRQEDHGTPRPLGGSDFDAVTSEHRNEQFSQFNPQDWK